MSTSCRSGNGCALSERAVEGLAQDEEPGECSGAPGARGTVALGLRRFMPLDLTAGAFLPRFDFNECNPPKVPF